MDIIVLIIVIFCKEAIDQIFEALWDIIPHNTESVFICNCSEKGIQR